MAKRVALDDVIDGLDMQADDMIAYLDRDTGAVVMVGDEIVYLAEGDERDTLSDWERELVAVLREVEQGSKRYVQLPDREDVHEWDIVRRFCDTVGDDPVKELLLRAIQGRGAFRRFKDELDRSGLRDRWFDFKRNALREIAIEWCMENAIPF